MVIAEKRLQVALHEVHREIFAEQELEAYCEARVAGHQRHLCAWNTTRHQCTNERTHGRMHKRQSVPDMSAASSAHRPSEGDAIG